MLIASCCGYFPPIYFQFSTRRAEFIGLCTAANCSPAANPVNVNPLAKFVLCKPIRAAGLAGWHMQITAEDAMAMVSAGVVLR